MTRFQNGVFDKGQAGFLCGIHAQFGLRHDIEAKICQQRGQLAHFPALPVARTTFCI
jgi:hypothetical protein